MRVLKKSIWPYQVATTKDSATIEQWCEDTIGKIYKDWFVYSSTSKVIYAFKDEGDYMVFKLRWGF